MITESMVGKAREELRTWHLEGDISIVKEGQRLRLDIKRHMDSNNPTQECPICREYDHLQSNIPLLFTRACQNLHIPEIEIHFPGDPRPRYIIDDEIRYDIRPDEEEK